MVTTMAYARSGTKIQVKRRCRLPLYVAVLMYVLQSILKLYKSFTRVLHMPVL
jgi:hypothetical protein